MNVCKEPRGDAAQPVSRGFRSYGGSVRIADAPSFIFPPPSQDRFDCGASSGEVCRFSRGGRCPGFLFLTAGARRVGSGKEASGRRTEAPVPEPEPMQRQVFFCEEAIFFRERSCLRIGRKFLVSGFNVSAVLCFSLQSLNGNDFIPVCKGIPRSDSRDRLLKNFTIFDARNTIVIF